MSLHEGMGYICTMVTKILGEAMLYAIQQHGDQMYGRKPYHVHLLDVVNVLRRFVDWGGIDQEMVDAAWLHDTVEDAGTPLRRSGRGSVFGSLTLSTQ